MFLWFLKDELKGDDKQFARIVAPSGTGKTTIVRLWRVSNALIFEGHLSVLYFDKIPICEILTL